MKSKAHFVVAIILLLTLTSTAQALTPKAGAKCTKAGATANASGKKFTCIKSGSKLVWNNGVLIKKPTPTQTPTPTPTPTQLTIERETWEFTYLKIWDELEKAQNQGSFPFNYKLSPTVNQERAKESIAAYDKAMKLWMAILDGAIVNPVVWTIMGEKDYEWWKQVVDEQEGKSANYAWDPKTNMLGHCQLSSIVFCGYGIASKPNAIDYKFLQYNVIGSNFTARPNANTVNHESVHFYQLSVTQSFPRDVPCWYVEGQASLYGGALEFNLNTKRSSSIRQRDNFKSIVRQYQPNADYYASKDWLEVLKNMYYPHISCSDQQDYFKYALGMFVWEYLYDQYGPRIMHQVLLDFKAGRSFNEASQMRMGPNLEQLNLELASHLVEVFAKSPPKSTVAPTQKPRPTPTFTPIPSPTPTPTPERSPDDLNDVICSKVNEIVKNSMGEFWCLKIGEQLRWSKNNLDPNPKPTPSAKPVPIPTPTLLTEQWKKSIEIIRSYRKTSIPNSLTLDFQASSNIPDTNSANIRSGLLPAVNFWAQFETLSKPIPVTVFSEKDYDWYMARWVALGRDNTGQGQWDRTLGFAGGAVGWNAEGQRNMWFKIPPNAPAEQSLAGIDRNLDYYFHEVTHFYQSSIIGERKGSAPCWFPEGAAMLIGYANSLENSESNFNFVSRARNMKMQELHKFLSDKSVSVSEILKLLNDYPASDPICQHVFPQLGYGLGWFVNERLVADYGWDRYLSFWRSMARMDWQKAFLETYSISFDRWASESFAPYMVELLNFK